MTRQRLDERHPAPDTPRFRAELDAYLRARTPPPTRRVRGGTRWLAGVGVAVVAALALVLTAPVTGDPPPSEAQAFMLEDGTRIPVSDFLDRANHDRLRKAFADAGATLTIHEVPVNPRAEGRVLGIDFGHHDSEPGDAEISVRPGDQITVRVGRLPQDDEQVTTEGLTLFEVFPEVDKAVQLDPEATREALEQLGFTVEWQLLTPGPRGWKLAEAQSVDAPPPDTYVMAVSGPDPALFRVDPDIDTLVVDVTYERDIAEAILAAHRATGG